MQRFAHVALALFAVVLLCGPTSASAQDSGLDDAMLDECLGDGFYPEGPPTCTFDADGNLISRSAPGEPGSGSGVGGFLVLALLWAGVPLLIAASVASSRGESIGLAVILTLVLGWIGLVIVLYGQGRAAGVVGGLAGEGTATAGAGSHSPATRSARSADELPMTRVEAAAADSAAGSAPGGAGTPATRAGAGVADRLLVLDDLHGRGLITDEERASRRAAILDEV